MVTISYRSSAGQGTFAGQRLTFYRCAVDVPHRKEEFRELSGSLKCIGSPSLCIHRKGFFSPEHRHDMLCQYQCQSWIYIVHKRKASNALMRPFVKTL